MNERGRASLALLHIPLYALDTPVDGLELLFIRLISQRPSSGNDATSIGTLGQDC